MTKALIPDPLNTDTECDRFYHVDIPDLDDTDLRDEINYIRPLLWGLPQTDWLRGRVRELEAELTKRKYSDQPTKARPQPKPKRLAEGVKL
jgi:hypothetical protein